MDQLALLEKKNYELLMHYGNKFKRNFEFELIEDTSEHQSYICRVLLDGQELAKAPGHGKKNSKDNASITALIRLLMKEPSSKSFFKQYVA